MSKKSVFVLIRVMAILILVIFSGCSKTTPASVPADTTNPVQTPIETEATQQVENTGPALNMMSVVEFKDVKAKLVVTGITEITSSDDAKAGYKFCSPWIYIKNTGTEEFSVDMYAFTMTDTDGNVYDSSVYTPGNYYAGVDVLPGGLIEGPIYFEVPAAAIPFALQIRPDLAWNDTNLIEVDLAQMDADPSDAVFVAEPVAYFTDTPVIELGTAYNFDGKLSITVNSAKFIQDDEMDPPNDSYAFYQLDLTVENLTNEDLGVTLDYMYKLYSPSYNHLIEQIPLPYAENELWVINMTAGDKQDYVLTFEAKMDSAENYLFLQDFFEENAPVLFALN